MLRLAPTPEVVVPGEVVVLVAALVVTGDETVAGVVAAGRLLRFDEGKAAVEFAPASVLRAPPEPPGRPRTSPPGCA